MELVLTRLDSDSASRELGKKKESEEEKYDGATFEERVCENLASSAVVDAAVADMAVEKSEERLTEMLAVVEGEEAKEYLVDERRTERLVTEAKKYLEECKNEGHSPKQEHCYSRKHAKVRILMPWW